MCACMCACIVQRLSQKAQLTKRLNGQSKGDRELPAMPYLYQHDSIALFFCCLFIHSLFVFDCSHCWVSPYNNSFSFTYLYVLSCLPQWVATTTSITANVLVSFQSAFLPISLGCIRSDLAMPFSFSYAPFPLNLFYCFRLVCVK